MKQAVRKGITLLLSLCMAMCFATVAMAEGEDTVYVAWIGKQGYTTLAAAVNEAQSGATITLGEGKYTLYKQKAETSGKDLTFVGQGADKTTWIIGAETPDATLEGTEYNGDYSFDGAGTIVFKEMTLNSGNKAYLGFIRAKNTVVENCTINGCTHYWGYSSAIFRNTVFNAKKTDTGKAEYSIYTYSSPEVTFDRCTFNCDGKAIKVYREGSSTAENPIYINVNDCIFNFKEDNKCAVNVDEFKNYYVVSFSGDNIVNGGKRNTDSCSRLFQIDTGVEQYRNTAKILTGDTTVWENGKLVSHDYSDGHKDNAFSKVTYTNWTKQADGTATGTRTAVCDYCGFEEVTQEVCKHGDSKTVGYVAATCTEKGYSGNSVCNVCGTVTNGHEIDIDPNNHDLSKVEAVDATTEKEGVLAHYECSRCGKWFWDKAATKEITNKNDAVIAKKTEETKDLSDTVVNVADPVVDEKVKDDPNLSEETKAVVQTIGIKQDEASKDAVASNVAEVAKAVDSDAALKEKAKEELGLADTNNILLVVKPYVKVTNVTQEESSDAGAPAVISMEIDLVYTVEAKDIANESAPPVEVQSETKLEKISKPTQIQIIVPTTGAWQSRKVLIRHETQNHGVQYYFATVEENGYTTFTVPAEHGFSPFAVMPYDERTVTVKLDGEQKTYDFMDVVNGTALPALSKNNYLFKGWKFDGIENQRFNMTAELFEALLTNHADTTVVNAVSVFEGPLSEHPEIEEAKKNGTWGVDENKPAATGKPAAAAVTPVRTSSIPKTSDDSNLMLWVCLMGLAALGLGGAVYMKKRNHQ